MGAQATMPRPTNDILGGTLDSRKPGDTPQSALPAGQPVTVNAGATLFFGADEAGTGIAERITLSPGAYNISYRPQDAKTGQLGTPIVFATNCAAIGTPDRRN